MAGYLAGDVDEWIYIDISDQQEDSIRFIKDCERAIGKEIQMLKSSEYRCVEDCVRAFGGFRTPADGFARCTTWLKNREYCLMSGVLSLRNRTEQRGRLKRIRRLHTNFH